MSSPFPRSAIYAASRGSPVLILTFILLGAAGLRIWSAGGDFWIDEVWSLDQMRVALDSGSPRVVASLFFHANTHALNTFYMAIIDSVFGLQAPDFYYRTLAIVTGVATVFIAGRIGLSWSRPGSVIAAILMAFSYPLVHYAGEARGYAMMMFAALSCYHLLHRYLDSPTKGKVVAFVAVSMIGLMSHLTFVVMQLGLGLWAACEIYLHRRSIITTMAKLIPLFGVQFIALVAYGTVAFNNMVRGGDCCPEQALTSIRLMVGLSLGFDAIQYQTLSLLLGITIICVLAIVWLSVRRDKSWIVLAVVILAFPLGIWLLETKPDVIHRYFLLSALMLLLLLARILSALWDRHGWHRIIAALALVLFLGGNASLLLNYSQGGRGQYQAAITHIIQRSDTPQSIAVFPSFSVSSVLRHHVRLMGLSERLLLDESSGPADWFINGYLYGKPPEVEITRPVEGYGDAPYTLSATFEQWGLSGDTWAIYRRVR